MAFYRCNHRLGEQHPCRPHRPITIGRKASYALGFAGAHRLQVGSGAERAVRAGQHRDECRLIPVETPESVGQLQRGRRVDRVGNIRTINGHHCHGAIVLVVDAHLILST
jgi:hypothetical protein